MLGPLGYNFAPGHDLHVSGALVNTGHYTIEMFFSLDETNDYRKLLDFQNLSSDDGLYNFDGALNFYDYALADAPSLRAGRMIHLVASREQITGLFTAYVDGALQLAFFDDEDAAVLSGANGILHFLRDDLTTEIENPRGYLDYLRLYDGPLTPAEAAALYAAAPPALTISRQGGAVEICWKGVVGKTYQLQRRNAADTGAWSNLGAVQSGGGGTICMNDTLPAGAGQRYYRVRIGP